MSFKDLQSFIKELDKKDELVRIKVEVDPELEITEITDITGRIDCKFCDIKF